MNVENSFPSDPRSTAAGPRAGRRRFLKLAALGLAGAGGVELAAPAPATARESSLKITRVSAFRVEAPRWKLIGRNSRLDVHGKVARDRILRIETDGGVEGVGSCSAEKERARELLGKDPLSYLRPGTGIVSPLDRGDAPLWDLAGRILDVPAWKLFGGYGPEWVPVYDGSIYFADLLPEHASRGIQRILEEADHALEQGHRAFKIKVGRGARWMEKEAGFARDVEVVRAIRAHVGKDVRLAVDANNGYDLATTLRFLDAVGDDLFFVEEMFPEDVAQDLELKEFLRKRGWGTLVADGESARDEEHFSPFIEARALDVVQGDIRVFGFTRLLSLARRTASEGIHLAPHNWGSFLGLYMQLVLGRGIPNLLIAEADPGVTELFDVSGFELREGRMRVPDAPGCGLELRRDRLADLAKVDWVLEA